jgi:hypothetical protein
LRGVRTERVARGGETFGAGGVVSESKLLRMYEYLFEYK